MIMRNSKSNRPSLLCAIVLATAGLSSLAHGQTSIAPLILPASPDARSAGQLPNRFEIAQAAPAAAPAPAARPFRPEAPLGGFGGGGFGGGVGTREEGG